MQPRLRLDIGWADMLSTVWPINASVETLERAVADHAPADVSAVVGLSVRTLFDALLAETAAGRRVSLSAVNIGDMAALAEAHGCDLDILDLDPDSLGVAGRRAHSPASVLIVVAHLYGRRAPLPAGRKGTLVVEDCAQAYDGRLSLSADADIALFSFGPIKTATALGGGVALFRDARLAQRVASRIAGYPELGDGWFLGRVMRIAVLKAMSHPAIYALAFCWASRGGRDPDQVIGGLARGFPGKGPIQGAIRRRPPPRMLRLLERRLRLWTPVGDASAEAAMTGLSGRLHIPGQASPGRWWVTPVLHHRPDALVAALRRRGQDATRGATSLRCLGRAGDLPGASGLMEQVVYLPRPASPTALRRLAKALDAALKDIE